MEFAEIDINLTRRALELAEKGVGLVSPNPLVGCVVTDVNGEIVGEGTYIFENVNHAEVIALKQAGIRANGGTAYVSLEPHSHFGNTPPCTDALLNAGIRRVVCPIEDPNPLVSGKGFAQLRERGVEVVVGVLADEARKQNEAFIGWHKNQRPFVHVKLAISLDGRISLNNSVSTTLSSENALGRVHQLRHGSDAILVGGNTAFVDNPSLTDRSGCPRRRPLVRVVMDNRLRIPLDGILVQSAYDTPTIVFTNSGDASAIGLLRELGVNVIKATDGGRNLFAVMDELKNLQIQSVLVEGGTEIAGAFFDAGLVDRLTFIVSPLIVGGHNAPVAIGGNGANSLANAFRMNDMDVFKHGVDLEITGHPIKGKTE